MPLVSLFMPTLRPGGAEKNAVLLANNLVSRGFDVHIVVAQSLGLLSSRVDPRVSVFNLQAQSLRASFVPLWSYLIKYKPDCIQARQWPLTIIAALASVSTPKKIRLVCSEHTLSSTAYGQASIFTYLLLRFTTFIFYRYADACFCVTQGGADDMAKTALIRPSKIQVINNMCEPYPRNISPSKELLEFAKGRQVILSVGTLKRVKNHPFLLQSISRLASTRDDFCLAIVGDGQEYYRINSLIADLGLQSTVQLYGHQSDPTPFYKASNVFALTSHLEGFVNVLIEALYFGLDIVSTNCPTGPSEILLDDQYGTLVSPGDHVQFASALSNALSSPRPPSAQHERAMQFKPDLITDAYQNILFPN